MNAEKKKALKKIGIVSLACLAVIAGSFGATWAYYSDGQSLENPLTTPHSGAAVVEEFDPDSSFLPGETVPKKVAFQNTGDMDLYLRVKIPPAEGWFTPSQGGPAQENQKLRTDQVIKEWTEYWGAEDTGNGGWADGTEWVTVGEYRYYKKVLPKGETTNNILESIKLSPEVSNDRHAANYSDQIYKLTFDAEAVPVYDDGQSGVEEEWNIKVTKGADGSLTWSAGS